MKNKISKMELLRTIIKCVKILGKYKISFVILMIFTNVLLGVLPSASLIVMQRIINDLQNGTKEFAQIVLYIFLYIGIDMAMSFVSLIFNHFTLKVSLNFTKDIERSMLDKAANLSLNDFEDGELHNVITRARSEGTSKILNFFTNILGIVKQTITILTSIIIVSVYEPLLIAFVLPIPIVKYIYKYKMNIVRFNLQKSRTNRERNAWYITHLIFTGTAFKEIRLFGLKDYFLKKYNQYKNITIGEDIEISKKTSKIYLILSILDNIISGSLFMYIVRSGYIGIILIGDVVTYTRCLFNIKNSIESSLSLIDTITYDALFVSQFFEFMNKEVSPEGTKQISEIHSIIVRNLSYKYKNSTSYVLNNVNFEIKKDSIILFVGLNGSGKTTLMKLILGFYNDYEGEILINGIELKNIDKQSYYRLTSCIFQDYIKYEATVRENIAFGDTDNIYNDKLIVDMVKNMDLDKRRELKLDTVLGSWFEGAEQLSGGEWQRISLGRVFFRDAELFVLDEPDSALDVMTEHYILDKYLEMLKGKIGVCSSHRFSRMSFFSDEILVLENGSIVERGNHSELIEKRGLYYNLYQKSINNDLEINCGLE